jgi:hypothetical protein
MVLAVISALLVTFLVPLLAFAPGLALTRRATEGLLPSERIAIAAAFGLGLLGVVLFTVGLASFNRASLGAVVLVMAVVWFLPGVRRELAQTLRAIERPRWPWATALGISLGFLLLSGLAEPVGTMGHDGISYHLQGPRIWLREGRIVPMPDFSLTAFPVSVEAIFGTLMAFSNHRAPCAIGAIYVALLLVQTHGLARWVGASSGWSLAAACTVVTMPVVVVQSTTAFVDVPYAVYALSAVRVALLCTSPAGIMVGGAFIGFAMGTKYTGLPLAFATVGVALVAAFRRNDQTALRWLAGSVCVGSLLALPFYLRNYLVLGSPIYPPPVALYDHLDVRYFPRAAAVAMEAYVYERGYGFGHGPLDLLLVPWRFSMFPGTFHGAGGIGIVPLGLGPIGWWVARKRAGMGELTVWSLCVGLVWFLTQQEARFVQVLFVIGAVLGALGANWLSSRSRLGLVLSVLVTGVSIVYGASTVVKATGPASLGPAALSALSPSRAEMRRSEIPFRRAFEALNAAKDVGRVLIVDPKAPPYYLDHPHTKIVGMYGETPFDGPVTLARLADAGVTHVFETDKHRAPPWLLPHLELLFAADGARVSRIHTGDARPGNAQGVDHPLPPSQGALPNP